MSQTVKEIKVVINGEEFVSKAAGAASTGMLGFVNKIPGWAQAAAVLAAAWKAIGAAVDFARDFVVDSIAVYDAYTASQTRLSAQSKLTGVALTDLKAAAKQARDEFGLSTTVANDAAVTTAKYASRAGDASQQTRLLKAALDLGAASGLNAADAMQALEQGLRGQDEGFDKLLGKNPSTIWKEYADANGLAAGKMSDTQKRMAELTAVVDAGNLVQGAYNARLETGAGMTEQLGNKSEAMKVAFGAALQPIRIFVIQGLTKLLEVAAPVVIAIGRVANAVGVTLVGMFKLGESAIGSLMQGLGKLTGNKSLEEWGRKQSQAMPEFVKELQAMEKKLNDSGNAATTAAVKHTAASEKIKTASGETVRAVVRVADVVEIRLGKPLADLIRITEGAIVSLSEAARDQLAAAPAAQFEAHMKGIAEQAGLVEARLTSVPDSTGKAARNVGDMATDVGTVARGALDLAEAFGVADASAARTLGSVINIATSLGRLAGGDMFGGAAGIIGGVANIVSSMMAGDSARRALLRQNNERLAELRDEVGNLDVSVSGSDLLGARSALETFADKLRSGGLGGLMSPVALIEALRNQGLKPGDLSRIADELGIVIKNKDGAFTSDGLLALLDAIKASEIGRVGTGFAEQLRFFRESQDLSGGDDFSRASGLLGFLRGQGGVRALDGVDASSADTLRASLMRIRGQLNTGDGIAPAMLGQLSGGDFNALLVQLIGSLGGGAGGLSTGAPASTTTPAGTGPQLGGATGPAGPLTKTLDDVVSSIMTQYEGLQAYHVSSLGFAERTADATEGSYMMLQSLRDMVSELVAGGMDSVDAALESRRRMSLLAAGQFPDIR